MKQADKTTGKLYGTISIKALRKLCGRLCNPCVYQRQKKKKFKDIIFAVRVYKRKMRCVGLSGQVILLLFSSFLLSSLHEWISLPNTKIIKIIKPTIKHTLKACWTEIIFSMSRLFWKYCCTMLAKWIFFIEILIFYMYNIFLCGFFCTTCRYSKHVLLHTYLYVCT